MKLFAVALLTTLFAGPTFAKGGDNPFIPGHDLSGFIAARQISVHMKAEDAEVLSDAVESIQSHVDALNGDRFSSFVLVKSANRAQFCLNLLKVSEKAAAAAELRKELSLIVSTVDTTLSEKLILPCR